MVTVRNLTVSQSTTVGPNIVPEDIVLYLDASNLTSYPGSGTTWYDISGNSNNFTLINSPTFTGNGFDFSANNVDFLAAGSIQKAICVNSTCGNFGTSSFTVEVIVNAIEGHATNGQAYYRQLGTAIKKRYGTTNWANTSIRPGWADATMASYFAYQNNDTGGTLPHAVGQGVTPGTDFGSICHMTFVAERSNSGVTNVLRRYKNGSLIGNPINVFNLLGTSMSVDSNESITLMYTAGEEAYIYGTLYLIRLYNKALTPLQVYQNFDATRYRYGI